MQTSPMNNNMQFTNMSQQSHFSNHSHQLNMNNFIQMKQMKSNFSNSKINMKMPNSMNINYNQSPYNISQSNMPSMSNMNKNLANKSSMNPKNKIYNGKSNKNPNLSNQNFKSKNSMNQNLAKNMNQNNNNNMNQNNISNINNNNDIQNQVQFQSNPFINQSDSGQNSMNQNNPKIDDKNNNDQNILDEICDTHTLKLSKYYEYKPSETTSHLNSLLKNMDNFGEITKNKIEQEKVSNPNKFISVEEALNYNDQNNMNMGINNSNNMINDNMFDDDMLNNPKNDFFVLSILKLALESEGCTCEIERDFPKNNEEKECYTAIQFIVNGMYKFKKYKFTFDFGEEKNEIMFNDLIIQNNFNNTLVKNLINIFNITKKDIVMTSPRKGPYQITAIIKVSNFTELTDIQLFNQLTNNPDYVSFLIKVEKSILLNGCKLNRKMLDSRGDRSIGWGVNEMRGGKPYTPPIGWIGYGLRVLDRYDWGDNTWLDYNNDPGEWSVAYHGMGSSLSGKIDLNEAPDNFGMKSTVMRQQFKKEMDKYHTGQVVGEGVYMTQFPMVMEQHCSVYSCQGKKYKIGIMCRVKPDKIRCPVDGDNFWVINGTDNEVRPYRILIKEIM